MTKRGIQVLSFCREGSWPRAERAMLRGQEGDVEVRSLGAAGMHGAQMSPTVLQDRLAVAQTSPAPVTLSLKINENLAFAIKIKNVSHPGK